MGLDLRASEGDLLLRPFADRDFQDLADLFEASFGSRPPADYFTWKYRENPTGEAIGFVADAGERLAAFYGVIPEPWSVGAIDATVYQSMDTMTHPEFQRRGLFVRLAELTYEEVARRNGHCDLVGIPGPTSLPGFTRKLGWKKIHDFDILTVPTLAVRAWPRRGDRAIEVEDLDRPSERIHGVLDHASRPEGEIWPRLKEAFFDWRVFGQPSKRWRVALASRAGRPVALCVYMRSGPRATLLAYAAGLKDEDESEWFPPLLRFVARHGAMLYTWRPQQARPAALYRAMGFRANPLVRRWLPQRVPLIVRSDADVVNGVSWADPQLYDLQPLMQD